MKSLKKYNSLVTVAHNSSIVQASSIVMQHTILKSNYELATNSFKIHNLHQVSEKFEENENIYILAHDVTEDFPEHNHSYFEMTYVCQGELLNHIDGNEIYMSAGDLSMLNPSAVQKLGYLSPNTLILNVCLKKDIFKRTLKSFYEDDNPISNFLRCENKNKRNYMLFSAGYNAHTQTLISQIIQEYVDSDYHQSFSLEALILLLFVHLVRTDEYSYYGLNSQALDILRYIRTNCFHNTLGEMAEKLGYNANYLSVYIKKHTGRNCRDIIQETKISEALRQLDDTDINIYDISENCGYSSPSHFFRIFRENFGMTPGEYRKAK